MKTVQIVVMACVCCTASVVSAKQSLKEILKAQAEQMALAMLPTNAVNEAAGFFAPVTQKYLPVFEQFRAEYRAAKDKLPVVEKYLPKAKEAYAEAKAMKVPEKYVARKDEYLKMFSGFLTIVSQTVATFGVKGTEAKGGMQ